MGMKFEVAFDQLAYLSKINNGSSQLVYGEGEAIFMQGDPADSVFYIQSGRVKKTYVSSRGKERVVAIFKPAEFFGVGCVIGQTKRLMTATAMTTCSVARIEKSIMVRLLYEQPSLAEKFISFLIDRNSHYQEDLVDHLFNSSEKRLARALLLLSTDDKETGDEIVVPKISQETLAEIVGTTRSRVNYFMNKFRQMGIIEYRQGIRIRRALLDTLLQEMPEYQAK